MDYLLDKRVIFQGTSRLPSLYSWSITEEKKNGGGHDDLIPWAWNSFFTLDSLQVSRRVYIKAPQEEFTNFKGDVVEGREAEVTDRLIIHGNLYSGTYWSDQFERTTEFSMFGTDRTFKKFDLSIEQSDSGQECCWLWGSPGYETEIDFRSEISDDTIVVNIQLNSSRFNEFVRLIEEKRVDLATIRLSGVDGFYSTWSPSIRTDYIKVLTSYQTVEGLDGVEVNLPKLGHVDDFEISLTTRNDLKGKFQTPNFYEQFKEVEVREEDSKILSKIGFKQEQTSVNLSKEQQLILYSKLMKGLKLPLWLIFIALVLILFK